ncbi:hypothetical protein KIN20_029379 [Parelaphostrongylus tenuis]|uniref:Uncharacterized protein n=1 Tax=Parelaphostrongylus tenuis TaxID=148309 RepID=A0AAD5R2F8_PARTN|nr:hypothetical protein KIN20_029379 [Parelaphostrongylus tenuis]
MLAMNGCEDKPCKHGGTCLPRFGKNYNCLCPPHRTGDNCEMDVDECAIYDGTHAGCQNNATCVNHDTDAIVVPDFTVLCASTDNQHALDQLNYVDFMSAYKCICDWGYKVSDDKLNPTCVDIDECQDNPCHPGVDCINLPGKFQCAGCPKGYHGNGQICADIDECAAVNYPCSSDPHVPCFNTIGSFHCGNCPPGYRGDGRKCRRHSACDDAPCHPDATCVEDQSSLNPGGFICHCPAGTMGDGLGRLFAAGTCHLLFYFHRNQPPLIFIDQAVLGEHGCQTSNSTICRVGKCMNGGTCKVSACIGNPCQNDGICKDDGMGIVKCTCPIGFYGLLCQFEENACGAHYTDISGNLTFPTDADKVAGDGCDFVIATEQENSALRITFTAFKVVSSLGSLDCSDSNLTLFDGVADNSPVFATFCQEVPVIGEAITMTSTGALLRLKGTSISFSLEWETKKRECGYRTNLASGLLVVPPHHLDTACDWFISAPMDKHIEIEIPTVEMTTGTFMNCSVNQLEVGSKLHFIIRFQNH